MRRLMVPLVDAMAEIVSPPWANFVRKSFFACQKHIHSSRNLSPTAGMPAIGTRYPRSGIGFRDPGSGIRVPGSGSRVAGSRFRASGLSDVLATWPGHRASGLSDSLVEEHPEAELTWRNEIETAIFI